MALPSSWAIDPSLFHFYFNRRRPPRAEGGGMQLLRRFRLGSRSLNEGAASSRNRAQSLVGSRGRRRDEGLAILF